MSFQVQILPRAQKQLANISSPYFDKIEQDIRGLQQDPKPAGCSKLTSRPGWRIRVNDYRVIYDINASKKVITVLDIGHRKDIYR